jgi:hypothetical protein
MLQAYGDTLWVALAIAAWDDIVAIIGELVPLPSLPLAIHCVYLNDAEAGWVTAVL